MAKDPQIYINHIKSSIKKYMPTLKTLLKILLMTIN